MFEEILIAICNRSNDLVEIPYRCCRHPADLFAKAEAPLTFLYKQEPQ